MRTKSGQKKGNHETLYLVFVGLAKSGQKIPEQEAQGVFPMNRATKSLAG